MSSDSFRSGAEKTPTALQVSDQAVCLVLRSNSNAANAGIHSVGQSEINDTGFTAEVDCGLGANVGQFLQATAPSLLRGQKPSFPEQADA